MSNFLWIMQELDSELSGRTIIGIKRMGELDQKSFLTACRKRFPEEHEGEKSAVLCSHWQEELKSQEWQPYKVVEKDGEPQVWIILSAFLFVISHLRVKGNLYLLYVPSVHLLGIELKILSTLAFFFFQ